MGRTCSARAACALGRSRARWRDWAAGWSTGSERLDSTETRRRCSDSSWGSRAHLRQQRGCTSAPGPRQIKSEGRTSYSVGRINWLPAVRVEPWTRRRRTPTSGDRTHRRSHSTPKTWSGAGGPAGTRSHHSARFGPAAAPRMKQDSRSRTSRVLRFRSSSDQSRREEEGDSRLCLTGGEGTWTVGSSRGWSRRHTRSRRRPPETFSD